MIVPKHLLSAYFLNAFAKAYFIVVDPSLVPAVRASLKSGYL